MEQIQQREPFHFSGSGGEYFRIWIVNLCLSIITLGIYSAWAKVRRTQYFYRNTTVAGGGFDYHGNPVAILKGRIIAVILFAGYSVVSHFSPEAGLAAFGLILLVMPWLLVRSLRFRLYNTSYRGLRFSFHGKTGDAYANFLLLPLVSYISLGFLWPLAHQQITRYTRDNSQYGETAFKFHGKIGAFYKPYMVLFGVSLLLLAVVVGAVVLLFTTGALHADGEEQARIYQFMMIGLAVVGVFYLALLLFAVPYLTARLFNLIWNNTTLDAHGFACHARARDLFVIMFGNLLLIILTLGLFKPFADVRTTRYLLDHMALLPGGDIDQFVAGQQSSASATGEETADMFDMDIAM